MKQRFVWPPCLRMANGLRMASESESEESEFEGSESEESEEQPALN